MAKLALSFLPFLLLLVSFASGEMLKMADGQRETETTWCVPKASSSEAELAANIHFACEQVNCRIIQEGGACYCPNTTINHASVAMNLYYRFSGANKWNCHFTASGLISETNPSHGTCRYA